ncbi:MAG TPA: FadR/GntR family transcriptional regulator [Chloroflexota bacterium]|nr:FadR/GntR family transcriptional regulator [Chloroflexota bacterium]
MREQGQPLLTHGEANFRALVGAGSPETLQAQIRRYIVEHGLQPGDRLPSEAELAAALGNSRLIVREALRALEAVGVLESRPGSGWFVRHFDVSAAASTVAQSLAFHPSVLLDLHAVRRSMEADLLAGLAGRLDERDLGALDELVDRMRWRAGRGQRFAAEDGEFHRRLVAASGNLVALALIDLYWTLMEALHAHGLPGPSPADAPEVAEAHGRIVAALRRGDGPQAAHTLRASHDEAQQRFSRWMESEDDPAGVRAAAIRAAIQAALLWPGRRQL